MRSAMGLNQAYRRFADLEEKNTKETTLEDLVRETGNKSAEAFSELCERFSPLVRSQVTRLFGVSYPDYDDRVQDALVALYDAALSYDLSQSKVTFGLYAKICIRNRLISIQRKEKRAQKKKSSLAGLENKALREEARRSSLEKLEENEEILSKLSTYEKKVLLLYLNGHSYREIGSALKKSEKSVDNALLRIRSKLKKLI